MLFILSVTAFYIFQLVTFALSFPKLLDMYRFYKYLLGVPDVSQAGVTIGFSANSKRLIFKRSLGRRSSDS